jgi:hypothetical protein
MGNYQKPRRQIEPMSYDSALLRVIPYLLVAQ